MTVRCCLVAAVLALGYAMRAWGADFYVSPKGSDANAGTKLKPFASLERARDAVRAAAHDGPVTVWLRGGDYGRAATFTLTAADSGSAGGAVVYRAMPGERVRVVGAAVVRHFTPWRGTILQADLRAQGVTDPGAMVSRGKSREGIAGMELFFRSQPMPLAGWPNDGWAYTAAGTADKAQNAFAYEGERAQRWTSAPDAWVHGYWYYDWADHYERVTSIDTDGHVIHTAAPNPTYGYRAGQRWRVVNVLEELDAPGEWYVDRTKGVLYFWPPAPMRDGDVAVSVLDGPLVRVEGASYVEFRDVTFAMTRADGVVVRDGNHVRVLHCVIADTGNAGVVIRGGADDAVEDSEIRDTGDGGVVLDGGDRKTLTAGRHVAARNHIHDYARWTRTYTPGVELSGVGNRVVGNTIDHAPHFAVWVHGNDHVVERNDIHTVAMETGDVGAYYIGADTTERGNTVRSNYFHNLGLGDVNAVYLDDESSGSYVIGNVIRGGARGAKLGGGSYNVFERNKFVNDDIGIHFDARGMGWQKAYFDGTNPALLNRLKAMPYTEEPWRSHYPQLVEFLKQPPGLPVGNVVRDNECWCRVWIDYRDRLTAANLDEGGNRVHAETAQWKSIWVEGMGVAVDTAVIVRRLVATNGTQATLHLENQGTTAQSGMFTVWTEPGVDASVTSAGEIAFSLKPGESTERTILVEHAAPVRVGVAMRGEGFVSQGVLLK